MKSRELMPGAACQFILIQRSEIPPKRITLKSPEGKEHYAKVLRATETHEGCRTAEGKLWLLSCVLM